MKKILITNAVPDEAMAPIRSLATVIQGPSGGKLMSRKAVLDLAPELDGIINQAELIVDRELLDRGRNLKIIANVAIGINNMDVKLMAERGVWATNTPDTFVDSTADCTLGLILSLLRKLNVADRYVRSGVWPVDGFQPGVWDGIQLSGKTLGIIGYGKIGKSVAFRARAFGMSIIYHDIIATDDAEYRELDVLMREADIITLHTPLTDSTHHLINAERLAQMKPGAFILNMARGSVIHEEALIEALESGDLAGAALDVFEFEPVVHQSLLEMDNVCLTPHIGGGTVESRHAARYLCAQNVAAVLRGERPLTPVNNPTQRT